MTFTRLAPLAAVMLGLASCASVATAPSGVPNAPEFSATLDSPTSGPATVRYRSPTAIRALHFAQELGGYRAQDWTPLEPGFRWVTEGDGERIERIDGTAFAEVAFTIPQLYRALPKSYAPFSPFSDGGLLIYSGQFHACSTAPCEGDGPLAISVRAPGRTVRIGSAAHADTDRFVSRDDGLNIYVGSRTPIAADGMVAIVDPGLPDALRSELTRALPASLAYFAKTYGRLSFTPQLFVSIDARPRADGHESTQGGTLPGQIFMHFDGAHARDRLAEQGSAWLDWFFTHEVAHLVQQDQSGGHNGDDVAAWMHEGGADAMAALALRAQGQTAYVAERTAEGAKACDTGLATVTLPQATAHDAFDLHYTCGLIAALAIDTDLKTHGSGLDAFNSHFFADVRKGADWSPATWFDAARSVGVTAPVRADITALVGDDAPAARLALASIRRRAGF